MSGDHLIAFEHFAELPARDDVGHGTIFLHTTDADLGNQSAIAVDQQFAGFNHPLIAPDIDDDKIPFRI